MEWNFRERVKEICTIKGITQKEVALKIGVTAISINKSLSGNSPSVGTLRKIADALGVELAQLFPEPQEERLVIDKKKHSIEKKANLLDKSLSTMQNTVNCPHCGEEILLVAITSHIRKVAEN